jgi:diaminopropionate ammonia-lyase
MRRLARPRGNDPAIVAGESGGAGLAGLFRAAADVKLRDKLKLDNASTVFVINTEGATDPARYRELVGAGRDAVLTRAASRIARVRYERDTALHPLRRSPCLSIWIDSNGK